MGRIVGIILFLFLLKSSKCASQLHLSPKPDSAGKLFFIQGLPRNFYTTHLGFFCQKEIQVQKALSLPIFFRLGSKSYVDKLEMKGKQPVSGGN